MSHLENKQRLSNEQRQAVLNQIQDSLAVLDKYEPNFLKFLTLDLQQAEENWREVAEKNGQAEFVALWKRSVSRSFLNTLRQSSLIR